MEVYLGYNNPEVFNCARLEFLVIAYYLFIFELAARPLKKDLKTLNLKEDQNIKQRCFNHLYGGCVNGCGVMKKLTIIRGF